MVNFRVNGVEASTLRRRAQASGRTLSEFARAVLLGETSIDIKAARTLNAEAAEVARALTEQVRRVGVNLNQIARRMNELRTPPPPDFEALLRDIRRYVREWQDL